MKLLVTGGTGFVGSHVIRSAVAKGYKVRALRRNSNSSPPIALPEEVEWCNGSINNVNLSWFHDVHAVIHLASAGVSPKKSSSLDLFNTNIHGSYSLLKSAVEAGVSRFIGAGSSHEYGNTARNYDLIPPDAALDPISLYGASKAAAFQLMRAYAHDKNIKFFYGRIFSAYGDGQYSGNFWPSLCAAALSGHDFPMTSGTQVSDFIQISDVASHLLRACNRDDMLSESPLVVNIGSGNSQSLISFAKSEWERLGAKGKLLPGVLPDRQNQINRLVPDLCGL